MKGLRYFVFVVALLAAGCTGHTDNEARITSDKVDIFADGVDKVTFAVEFMGADVTAGAEIRVGGVALAGNSFTTQTPGIYRFTAVHEGAETYLPVVVTAREAVLLPSTDWKPEGQTNHFTVRATYGSLDVSTDAALTVTVNGTPLERDADGYYRFTTEGDEQTKSLAAQWKGQQAAPITVGRPKNYYKRVAVLEFTGTWCNNCPDMATYIKAAGVGFPDRAVVLAAHAFRNDPMASTYFETLATLLKADALPTVLLDLGKPIVGTSNTSASDMETRLRDIAANNPADCGMSIAVAKQGNTAVATVTLASHVTAEYGIAVALVESGVTGYPQTMPDYSKQDNYVHDHVLRKVWADNIEGVPAGRVEAGGSVTREFTFDMTGYNASNCAVAVFATTKAGDKTVVVNAAECKVGQSEDFKYEQL